MDWALYYLSFRSRTVREVECYLDEKQFGEIEVYDTVNRLQELGLLDDKKYAEEFVRTRLNTKAVSKRHLAEQLRSHSIPKDIIEAVLDTLPDESELKNATDVAKKYYRQLEALPENERKERTLQRLVRRGYSYDVAHKALTAASEEPIDDRSADD